MNIGLWGSSLLVSQSRLHRRVDCLDECTTFPLENVLRSLFLRRPLLDCKNIQISTYAYYPFISYTVLQSTCTKNECALVFLENNRRDYQVIGICTRIMFDNDERINVISKVFILVKRRSTEREYIRRNKSSDRKKEHKLYRIYLDV